MSEEMDREEVTALKAELGLMTYRLSAIESKLEESLTQLSAKIDLLLERYSETREKQALDSQALAAANQEIKKMENRVLSLEKDIVNVKITVAEKIVYGGLGGGFVAGLLQLLEMALK